MASTTRQALLQALSAAEGAVLVQTGKARAERQQLPPDGTCQRRPAYRGRAAGV